METWSESREQTSSLGENGAIIGKCTEDLESAGLIEGDPKKVFEAVAMHARDKEKGVEDAYSPAVFYMGGGMRGADGVGTAMAMQRQRLLGGFDTVAGVSTGASMAASHVTDQFHRGSWFYRVLGTSKEFINPWNYFLGKSIADLSIMPKTYRGEGRVRPYKTDFDTEEQNVIIGVTNYETGEQMLVRPTPDTLIDVVHASSAMPPPVYQADIRIPHILPDNRRVTDGDLSNPLPIRSVLADLEIQGKKQPTHILVVANRARTPSEMTKPQKYVEKKLLAKLPEGLRAAYDRHEQTFQAELEYLRNSGIPYVVIWTDGSLGTFSRNKKQIPQTTLRSFLRTSNTIKHYVPQKADAKEEDNLEQMVEAAEW